MEDRANRDERNPLPFWLLARGDSFFSFFSPYHCLPYWPWACEANRAAEESCGRFNIISLTETSDLFCMWSMKKCETLRLQRALTVTTHTCIEALCPLSAGCLLPGKSALLYLPKGTALPSCFVFYLIFSLILSLNISCSFWFRENHRAYTIGSPFFFTPHRCLPSHPLMSLSILHSSPSKLHLSTKGAPMLSQIGVEMGSCAIDKFHSRGDHESFSEASVPPQVWPRPSTGSVGSL